MSYQIYTGFWKNHSYDGWYAASLTLDVTTGALVVAALATFITIVGSQSWRILAFSIHQSRTSKQPRDGVHHQHQVVYRNESTQMGVVWLLCQIAWAWRRASEHNTIRAFAFALPPLLCFVAFTAASILSSRVAAPGYAASYVLLKPKDCGMISFIAPSEAQYSDPQGLPSYARWSNSKSREATNYARTCGSGDGNALSGCDRFVARQLSYTTRTAASCPFRAQRCLLGDGGSFQMETSWLDSHAHLGINAPSQNRIRFRRVSTCSILKVDDLTSSYQALGTDVFQYHLGVQGSPDVNGVLNFTHSYTQSATSLGFGYTIASTKAADLDPYYSRGWQPIPDLNRTDADVSIFFLNQNSLKYLNPVFDPFFRATKPFEVAIASNNVTYYAPDDLTTVMACTDQFQIQNPNNNQATHLTSSARAILQALDTPGIGLNLPQSAAVIRLNLISYDVLMFNSVNGLGAGSLLAQEDAYLIISQGLPDNQWQRELEGWFKASLATWQDRVIYYASKNMSEISDFARLSPMNDELSDLQAMCSNQIVRNVGAYQTFSVLGIGIILGVGVFLIIVSWSLEPFVTWIQHRRHPDKRESWVADSLLQLQRMAYQAEDLGGEWTKCDGEVPITASKTKFLAPGGHLGSVRTNVGPGKQTF